jgi:hypothetical protein
LSRATTSTASPLTITCSYVDFEMAQLAKGKLG